MRKGKLWGIKKVNDKEGSWWKGQFSRQQPLNGLLQITECQTMKQKLIAKEGVIDESIIIVGDLNTPM